MRFNPVTQKGYSLFEVASALQKSIRRGHERESLYWGYELEISGYGKYLWKRLVIIAMEDIGPAEPQAISLIHDYREAYDTLKRQKSGETNLSIASAIVYLSRAPKSRLYDWAKCWMTCTHFHHNLQIPDYALDIHTRRGKQAGKTINDFFETGCKIAPHHPAEKEDQYMEAMRKLFCENTRKELEAMQTHKALPEDHPDWAGFRKKPTGEGNQPELFEGS